MYSSIIIALIFVFVLSAIGTAVLNAIFGFFGRRGYLGNLFPNVRGGIPRGIGLVPFVILSFLPGSVHTFSSLARATVRWTKKSTGFTAIQPRNSGNWRFTESFRTFIMSLTVPRAPLLAQTSIRRSPWTLILKKSKIYR